METIHLIGVEDVARAGCRISDAASRIERAVSSFQSIMDQAYLRLDESVSRISNASQSFERLADSVDDIRNEMIARMETKVPTPSEMDDRAPNPAALEDLTQLVSHAAKHSASSGQDLEVILRDILKAMREPIGDECPGCIDCGPPIVVKAEDRCGKVS